MNERTATVEYLDEDYGFWCRLEITAEFDPADLADMVGSPKEVCCLDSHIHLAHGDPIQCVPNEDETRSDYGMRIWKNATKSWQANVKESWVMKVLEENAKRESDAEYYAQTAGHDRT